MTNKVSRCLIWYVQSYVTLQLASFTPDHAAAVQEESDLEEYESKNVNINDMNGEDLEGDEESEDLEDNSKTNKCLQKSLQESINSEQACHGQD